MKLYIHRRRLLKTTPEYHLGLLKGYEREIHLTDIRIWMLTDIENLHGFGPNFSNQVREQAAVAEQVLTLARVVMPE